MSLTAFLFLPLVGGYAFSIIWNASRYLAARESGHKLYFRAIFYAVFLMIVATEIHVIFFHYPWYQNIISFVSHATQGKDASVTIWSYSSKLTLIIISFILGPSIGHILNLPNSRFLQKITLFQKWQKRLLKNAIKNNDFELLIERASYHTIPIFFSLQCGKVYVGLVVRSPNPIEERKAIRILPIMSGYRETSTQEAVFTTFYLEIFKKLGDDNHEDLSHLDPVDFEVVIPSDQISSSHLFDLNAYEHFKENQQNK
jgi:hypothetical protein